MSDNNQNNQGKPLREGYAPNHHGYQPEKTPVHRGHQPAKQEAQPINPPKKK